MSPRDVGLGSERLWAVGGEEYSMQEWADIGDTRVVIDWSELPTVNTVRKGNERPAPVS